MPPFHILAGWRPVGCLFNIFLLLCKSGGSQDTSSAPLSLGGGRGVLNTASFPLRQLNSLERAGGPGCLPTPLAPKPAWEAPGEGSSSCCPLINMHTCSQQPFVCPADALILLLCPFFFLLSLDQAISLTRKILQPWQILTHSPNNETGC